MTSPHRLFIIHAGTHKTATTYIQSRIRLNAKKLGSLGVCVRYPGEEQKKHKPLAEALQAKKWKVWKHYLASIPDTFSQVLVSAEQFTQPVADPEVFSRLNRLLVKHGFRMRVVVFIRDQPDYINAMFVHSTRRLYHYLGFEEYVEKQLAERQRFFDYSYLFSQLLACPDLETCFLPFRSGLGDPFERLMQSQAWAAPSAWEPADPREGNIQPGTRGVWVAQEVARLLADRKIHPSRFTNKSAAIRRIAEREGWTSERYYGFTPELQVRVAAHYSESNEQFAQKVWGRSWRDVFPLSHPERRVYQPDSNEERVKMQDYVQEALSNLS